MKEWIGQLRKRNFHICLIVLLCVGGSQSEFTFAGPASVSAAPTIRGDQTAAKGLTPLKIYLNVDLQYIPDQSRIRSFRLIKQAFYELGYKVDFGYQPAKRLIESVDEGKVNVICLRSSGMENVRENILRVPVSVHQLDIYAYVEASTAPGSRQWKDMDIETLGLLYGAQDPRPYIPEPLLKKKIVRTPDRLIGAKMVRANRLDMVVFPEIIFHAHEELDAEVMSGLAKLSPALGSIESYCFLNKSHKFLYEPLTAALRRLKLTYPEQFDDKKNSFLLSDDELAKLPQMPGFAQ